MGLLATEDGLIAHVKATLGNKVRAVDSLPGDWDEDTLKAWLRVAPAVYITFNGGKRPGNPGASAAAIDARWIFYVVTAHASGEAARRRGDGKQVGAYELIDVLVPALNGHLVPDEGTLALDSVENLYSGKVDKQGVTVYAITLQMLKHWPTEVDEAALASFETFDAQWDIPRQENAGEHRKWLQGDTSTSKPDAHDSVQMPQ